MPQIQEKTKGLKLKFKESDLTTLTTTLEELRFQLDKLILVNHMSKLKDTAQIRKTKRQIAMAKTFIRIKKCQSPS